MNIYDALAVAIGLIVILDILYTLLISQGGIIISTCTRCNKQFSGTFLIAVIQQTVHRCDDNLI